MFQKDRSASAGSGGQKARDAAVRKSDRKRLLQTAAAQLLGGGGADGTAAQQQQKQPQQATALRRQQQILEAAFLKGSLVQRSLRLPSSSVQIYFRSPSPSSSSEGAEDGDDVEEDSTSCCAGWPYRRSPQCVWLQVNPAGGAGQAAWQVPGLALLAVLCHGGIGATNTAAAVVEIPSHASRFVCRGADVMRAGILRIAAANSNNHSATDPVVAAVTVRGNPQPFAVGVLHPDLVGCGGGGSDGDNNNGKFGPGTRGPGVTVVHCYGDDLWRQQAQQSANTGRDAPSAAPSSASMIVNRAGGAPFDDGHYGNVGFVEGRCVVPIGRPAEEESEEGGAGAPAIAAESGDTVDHDDDDDDDDDAGEPADTADTAATVGNDEASNEGSAVGEDNPDKNGDSTDAAAESETLSPDEILHEAVCRALASLSAKRDLPMSVATFYAQHVLRHRPPNATVQLKQTRYKKFGAYVADQVQAGLLTVGPDPNNKKNDPLAVLKDFDRRHEDLRPFLEEKRNSNAAGEASTSSSSNNNGNKRLVLADLYCIPNHFVSLLRLDGDTVKAVHATSEERRGTGMLTLKEARQVLEDYLEREELSADNNSSVQLDGPLTDVFYKKNKKKNKNSDPAAAAAVPTILSRKDAMAQWQACLEPAYALVQVPGNAVLKLGRGKPPQVTIEVTRRQSKKFLTAVRGLDAFGVDAAAFARNVAHRFACSSSVQPVAGGNNPNNSEAQFQGNLADELEALLVGDESLSAHGGAKGSTYHLPNNAIDVVLRKGVPARKKRGGGGKTKK